MNPEEHDLLLRSLDAPLTNAEAVRLEELLKTSPAAKEALQQYRTLRIAAAEGRATSFGPGFVDDVAKMAFRGDESGQTTNVLRLVHAPPKRWVWASVAATVVVLVIAIGLWQRPQTVSVPYGVTEVLELPDGSEVALASGASLQYASFWGRNERRVKLSGEGYFKVVSGERPFVVETFNAEVKVLGTEFNVRAWPEDTARETVVPLAEGRVDVGALNGGRAFQLTPGQSTRVKDGAPDIPSEVSVDRALAWRSGGLAFVDQPLADVFREIERRFNITITTVSVDVASRTVTYLHPDPQDIEGVLGDICAPLNLRYRPTVNGFEILAP